MVVGDEEIDNTHQAETPRRSGVASVSDARPARGVVVEAPSGHGPTRRSVSSRRCRSDPLRNQFIGQKRVASHEQVPSLISSILENADTRCVRQVHGTYRVDSLYEGQSAKSTRIQAILPLRLRSLVTTSTSILRKISIFFSFLPPSLRTWYCPTTAAP